MAWGFRLTGAVKVVEVHVKCSVQNGLQIPWPWEFWEVSGQEKKASDIVQKIAFMAMMVRMLMTLNMTLPLQGWGK